MAETTMPAAEAVPTFASDDERARYELAFHVLPTVAEGEVTDIVAKLKADIEQAGGEIFAEEPAQRIDLAYEVVEHIEGKNRKFKSAYFGWVRFALEPQAIEKVTAEVDGSPSILRYLLIRLTKIEEQRPFYYHQAMKDQKMVSSGDDSEVVPDTTTVAEKEPAKAATTSDASAEGGEANSEEIDEALKKDI